VLQAAIAPLRKTLGEKKFKRLAQALSLSYGLEVLLVLQDMWGLDFDEAQDVAQWTASALVRTALADASSAKATPPKQHRKGKSAQ
jgi:hypothetical protein